ncbi:MAG: TIR domain-containing protein [Candidatus Peribacteria bacterium]|nr:TIR domain-containing protein [Candidatus Peribacteria bacterium]
MNTDVSTEYVKRVIQEGYLDDSSVCVVLIGTETYKRKHVDWEISAAIHEKV